MDHYEHLQVEEVYNFTQDDLLTEDMMILDTHVEVFVWVGQSVDAKEKQSAFEIGQVPYSVHVVNILHCIYVWNSNPLLYSSAELYSEGCFT